MVWNKATIAETWFSTVEYFSLSPEVKFTHTIVTEFITITWFPSFTYSSSVRDLGVGLILDSSLIFSDHIVTLTRSCYFHLRRLRAIRRTITPTVFATSVHAFICSGINYCNSLLMGLPKSRLSAIQSVLNAAARLIARLPRFTHISTYMTEII